MVASVEFLARVDSAELAAAYIERMARLHGDAAVTEWDMDTIAALRGEAFDDPEPDPRRRCRRTSSTSAPARSIASSTAGARVAPVAPRPSPAGDRRTLAHRGERVPPAGGGRRLTASTEKRSAGAAIMVAPASCE